MKSFTNWVRKDFGNSHGIPPQRTECEIETNQDLQKEIPQLICDVHEHARSQTGADDKMVWMTARMVSMMGRVALEHERVGRKLVFLSWVLVWLTVALSVLTGWLIYLDLAHPKAL